MTPLRLYQLRHVILTGKTRFSSNSAEYRLLEKMHPFSDQGQFVVWLRYLSEAPEHTFKKLAKELLDDTPSILRRDSNC
jgi:hypothetical protein